MRSPKSFGEADEFISYFMNLMTARPSAYPCHASST